MPGLEVSRPDAGAARRPLGIRIAISRGFLACALVMAAIATQFNHAPLRFVQNEGVGPHQTGDRAAVARARIAARGSLFTPILLLPRNGILNGTRLLKI